jgi:hypothetical protein
MIKKFKLFERVINSGNINTITPEEKSSMTFNIGDIVKVTNFYNPKERSFFYEVTAYEAAIDYQNYWLRERNGPDIGWVDPKHMILVPDYEVAALKYNM